MPLDHFISLNLIIIFILQIKNKFKEVDGKLIEGRNSVFMFTDVVPTSSI